MANIIPELLQQLSRLTPTQQNILAAYFQTHLDQILAAAEKERRIATGTYTLDDFNEETQETIRNIENGENSTVCEDVENLYRQLEI
ncbi:MAG: hypothetical protein F6J87_26115 [Spirulina sp. SIO3F2]|nr:hypothetical protein [Spirulina sp. SIO3F2]